SRNEEPLPLPIDGEVIDAARDGRQRNGRFQLKCGFTGRTRVVHWQDNEVQRQSQQGGKRRRPRQAIIHSQSRGRTLLNMSSSATSYADLSTPHSTSGAAIAPAANMTPVKDGLSEEARLRGTAVKLAAAGRSAGVTTDMTYAPRAGTSICDSRLRTSSRPS